MAPALHPGWVVNGMAAAPTSMRLKTTADYRTKHWDECASHRVESRMLEVQAIVQVVITLPAMLGVMLPSRMRISPLRKFTTPGLSSVSGNLELGPLHLL